MRLLSCSICCLLAIVLFAACSDLPWTGTPHEVKEYAKAMEQYFDGVLGKPELDDVELLVTIEPPAEMQMAHDLLRSTAASCALARVSASNLEARDDELARLEAREKGQPNYSKPACVNRGFSESTISFELEDACRAADAAFAAYLDATMNWTEQMATACHTTEHYTEQAAIDDCLD